MSRDTISHSHGDTGTQPNDGLDFQQNGRPKEQHFDWWWTAVIDALDGHASEFARLDSDDDGTVDRADYADDADASTYKGNDVDTDGDGTVDSADTAATVKGNDIDSNGDGTVDRADYADDADASTYKGLDIDSNGDGKVDSADSADSATDATNVTSTYKGNDIDSNGDGNVDQADYASDSDASTYKGNDIDSDGDGVVDEADLLDGYEANTLLFSGGELNLPSKDINSGDFTALARYPSVPAGTTLRVHRAVICDGNFNTPAGLNLIVYDATNNTTLASYNGYSTPDATIDISGLDVLICADNGNFGSGTGSNQSNVTAEFGGTFE